MAAPEDVSAFRVTVPSADEDVATALLYEAGTIGLQVDIAGPDAVLLAYFRKGAATAESILAAVDALPVARIENASVPDVDWVARFRETFRPFHAGSFHIVPAWAADDPGPGRRLVVDPGQAFGTGTHESTRLSLAALEEICAQRVPRRVLDVGSGSGILAVAARLLGAELAVGIEIDADALPSAREHAALNGTVVRFVRGDGARCVQPARFDVVLANIAAPLLVERAAELRAACRAGGALVLAGLLRDQAGEVREAFAGRAESVELRLDGEWAALLVRGIR